MNYITLLLFYFFISSSRSHREIQLQHFLEIMRLLATYNVRKFSGASESKETPHIGNYLHLRKNIIIDCNPFPIHNFFPMKLHTRSYRIDIHAPVQFFSMIFFSICNLDFCMSQVR